MTGEAADLLAVAEKIVADHYPRSTTAALTHDLRALNRRNPGDPDRHLIPLLAVVLDARAALTRLHLSNPEWTRDAG